jgi:murein DD-endopeptidase MepM/ murein hydrolase activator NlpD
LVLAVAALFVVTTHAVVQMLFPPPLTVLAVATPEEIAPRAAPDPVSNSYPLAERRLAFPVKGYAGHLRDTFAEGRAHGRRRHQALDIMAPRGTPVIAADDGRVARVYRSLLGGLGVYQFDRDEKHVFYYAHLDRYAPGLAEGAFLRRGDLVGYVGSTGNAPRHAPHLHFAMYALGKDKRWWKGTAVDPYPLLKSE